MKWPISFVPYEVIRSYTAGPLNIDGNQRGHPPSAENWTSSTVQMAQGAYMKSSVTLRVVFALLFATLLVSCEKNPIPKQPLPATSDIRQQIVLIPDRPVTDCRC